MKIQNLYIKKIEGTKFGKKSGDNNKIHLDYLTGYNSLFGDNIVHGCYVLIKFLELIKCKNYKYLKVNFYNGIFYESFIKVKIIKRNNNQHIYELIQDNEIKVHIEISIKDKNIPINELKKILFRKNYLITKKIKKKFINKKIDSDLNLSLNFLTKYVGMIYPGKYSLISEIIVMEDNIVNNNNIEFKSSAISRHNVIYNNFLYKKYNILFQTLIRPNLFTKTKKINSSVLNQIKNNKNNVLIIGGSSGIGNDLFRLFKINKKNKIIATFNQNRILNKKKNIVIKKINIEKNIDKIFSIIKLYKPLLVYYFATPKINLNINSKKNLELYNRFYVSMPIKIIKFCIKHKCYFFYPSTTFIDGNIKNLYVDSKKNAEKKIRKIKNNKLFVNILRIPQINTKQNLSIIKRNLPYFSELICKKKNIRNMVFFKNLL